MSNEAKLFRDVLDRLEAEYGPLVEPGDPVEAGVLTLLAWYAPRFAVKPVRDRIREAFVDWNEARVADVWDVTHAMGAKAAPEAQQFAQKMLRFLRSLHSTLNRCRFDLVLADPDADVEALVEKMRGAPPPVKSVVLAGVDPERGWHLRREVSKLVQKWGLVAKTTSTRKAGRALGEIAEPGDRLRAHYLLTRYATRKDSEPDPLEGMDLGTPKRKTKKSAKKATAPKKAAATKATTAKKTSTKKAAKTATKKTAAKKSAKKTTAKGKQKTATKKSTKSS